LVQGPSQPFVPEIADHSDPIVETERRFPGRVVNDVYVVHLLQCGGYPIFEAGVREIADEEAAVVPVIDFRSSRSASWKAGPLHSDVAGRITVASRSSK
jgi:hypothetical protein